VKRIILAVAIAAAMFVPASAYASSQSPTISGASGSPASASTSSVSVSIGSFTSALTDTDYRACVLYVNNSGGAASGQTFGLSAGQGSWSGEVGFAPGQTLYVQLGISTDPGCGSISYSNIASFTVSPYAAPAPPAPASTPPAAPGPASTVTSVVPSPEAAPITAPILYASAASKSKPGIAIRKVRKVRRVRTATPA
jgi:hypothetical protein